MNIKRADKLYVPVDGHDLYQTIIKTKKFISNNIDTVSEIEYNTDADTVSISVKGEQKHEKEYRITAGIIPGL